MRRGAHVAVAVLEKLPGRDGTKCLDLLNMGLSDCHRVKTGKSRCVQKSELRLETHNNADISKTHIHSI